MQLWNSFKALLPVEMWVKKKKCGNSNCQSDTFIKPCMYLAITPLLVLPGGIGRAFPPSLYRANNFAPYYSTYSVGTGTNQKDKDPLGSFHGDPVIQSCMVGALLPTTNKINPNPPPPKKANPRTLFTQIPFLSCCSWAPSLIFSASFNSTDVFLPLQWCIDYFISDALISSSLMSWLLLALIKSSMMPWYICVCLDLFFYNALINFSIIPWFTLF